LIFSDSQVDNPRGNRLDNRRDSQHRHLLGSLLPNRHVNLARSRQVFRARSPLGNQRVSLVDSHLRVRHVNPLRSHQPSQARSLLGNRLGSPVFNRPHGHLANRLPSRQPSQVRSRRMHLPESRLRNQAVRRVLS
jgi:hypothetical protein